MKYLLTIIIGFCIGAFIISPIYTKMTEKPVCVCCQKHIPLKINGKDTIIVVDTIHKKRRLIFIERNQEKLKHATQ